MFYIILYCGAGIYLLLMLAGLLHRDFVRKMNRYQKYGLAAMGGGLLVLGLYYVFFFTFMASPEGQRFRAEQDRLRRQELQTGAGSR